MVVYSYIGLFYAPIFLIIWFLGMIFVIKSFINGIGLKFYTKEKYPDTRVSFFLFIHKKDRGKLFYFPQAQRHLFRLILKFGSRDATEEWLNVFMDVNKLRKLNDKKINKYLDKLIISTSWFVKLFVILAVGFLIVWFIIPIESKIFNLPPQP